MTMTVTDAPAREPCVKPVERKFRLIRTQMTCDYATNFPALPLRPPVFLLDDMKRMRHNFTVSSDALKTLHHELERYRAHFEPTPIRRTVIPHTEGPIHSEIILNLNKLTSLNFSDVINTVLTLATQTDDFEEFIARKISELAIAQMAFAPLYTSFVKEIAKTKPGIPKWLDNFAFLERTNATARAYVIGCFAEGELVNLERVFEEMKRFIELETDESLTCLFYLAMNAGKIVERRFPESTEMFNKLKHLQKEHKMRTAVHILDLLEARENNWRTEHLMPKLVFGDQKEVSAEESNESNGNRILQEYIYEQTLPPYFSSRMARDVMIALAMAPQTRFRQGIGLFEVLGERKDLKGKAVMEALQETLRTVSDRQVLLDCPEAVVNCGAIFAVLVKAGMLEFNMFGDSAKFPFEPSFFKGFLLEAEEQEMYDMVLDSPWMAEMKFRPAIYSHFHMTLLLSCSDMITCWPVYEAMAEISSAMNDGADPADVTEILKNEISEEIVKSVEFAEFATEVIVMWKPEEYLKIFMPIVKNQIDKALFHVERIGQIHHWSLDQIAKEIAGLAHLVDYDIDKWNRNSGSKVHDAVMKRLKRLYA